MLKIGCACKVLEKVKNIEDLLKSPRFGLREIKEEVKDIEDALDNLLPGKGPLSTGPFNIMDGPVAIKVSVQNVGKGCIDAVVRLFDIECCPPRQVDCKVLRNIGRSCAEDTVLCANEGIFEVVICPKPDKAPIRGFVTVKRVVQANPGPNAANLHAELVFRAADLLPVVCPFCKKKKRDHDCCDPCREEPDCGCDFGCE